MKIIVCIKQVPDTKGGVAFNPDGTLNRAAMLAIMNPDDKAGLEAALRLKDELGAEVTVLTMGLPKATDMLREAYAMGADKMILVTDRVLGGADTWATSSSPAVRQSTVIPHRSDRRSQSTWVSRLSPIRRTSRSTASTQSYSASSRTDTTFSR